MKYILIVVTVLMIAACGGESEPTPTTRPVPTFTATALAATVVPPNETPEPVILVPTDTPPPAATEDVVSTEYREGILKQGKEIAEGIQTIARLMQDPKLTDNGWIVEMGISIARIEIAKDEVSKLVPPPSLTDFNDAMIGASTTCANFASTLSSAIDNSDGDTLRAAMALLEACAGQLSQANKFLPQ